MLTSGGHSVWPGEVAGNKIAITLFVPRKSWLESSPNTCSEAGRDSGAIAIDVWVESVSGLKPSAHWNVFLVAIDRITGYQPVGYSEE